jgi:hypothetical protein
MKIITRFAIRPLWVLRAPFVSLDSIINSVEVLAGAGEVAKGLSKFLCFRNTDTLTYGKSEIQAGDPVNAPRRVSLRMISVNV